MAYSGTGTQADPFIVDNWTDFLSVVNTYQAYIKWADSAVKVINSVTITSTISSQFCFVDFNGWTISELTVNLPDSSYMVFSADLGDNVATNLTVEKMYVNRPDVQLGFNELFSCYFDKIEIGEVSENSDFWRGTIIFTLIKDAYHSVFRYKTENRSIIMPHGSFYNCLIEVDYKYDLDTAVWNKNYIFGGSGFTNCYICGKIDLQGSGSFGIIQNIGAPLQPVVLFLQNTVINLEITTNGTTIESTTGQWDITYGKACFVTNNGNNNTRLRQLVPNTICCFTGDIKNIDYLANKGFPATYDDNYRNNQYYDYKDLTSSQRRNIGTWTWRQRPIINEGISFLPFWFYPTVPGPQPAEPVVETPYITVYDMGTKQNEFNNHGLGVLKPTQSSIIEELNGEYTLNMVHPIDEEGMWQTLLEMNIVKDLGQLFVIQRVDEVQRGGSGYISVYAEHISYTLNDSWIFPPFSVMGYYGQTLIDSIMQQATDMGGDWQIQYNFDITTNVNAPDNFYDWEDIKDGATPYEMLLGANGFIAKLGGELYRDNFTLSIRDRMQGAQDNAFEMAIGYNLTGIKRTVDLSTFCTYFRGYDVSDGNYETWFAVSWDPASLPRAYPRNVVRSQNFTYEHPETAFGQLERDTMAFFNANCAPLISYELTVKDLKNNPDFKMFTNNYRYKVGDKGRVWDERLQAWVTLEITRTEKDGITGECRKVVIGTQRSFTRPSGYPSLVPPMVIPSANKTIEGVSPVAFYSNGDNLIDYTIYGASGGIGIMSDNLHYGGIEVAWYLPYNGQLSPGATGWIASKQAIKVEPDTEYTFSVRYMPKTEIGLFELEYDKDMNFIGYTSVTTSESVTSFTFTTSSTTKYMRFEITGIGGYDVPDFGDFNLNFGATKKPYSVYGCTIPVIISDGVHSQTVTLTVDQPLDEGDSVSKDDTGVSIPTYPGYNNIAVDTTINPRIKITYKEG